MKLLSQNPCIALMLLLVIMSCRSVKLVSVPISDVNSVTIKRSQLSEKQVKHWGHLDLILDTIPGMSIVRAYKEVVKTKTAATTIVAVIDSGIDINHEDLAGVIWKNIDEIPDNNIDDDNNGYIDDINGWNFLAEAYYEQLEYVRILTHEKNIDSIYKEAETEYKNKLKEYSSLQAQYRQIIPVLSSAHQTLSSYFNKTSYSQEEFSSIKTEDQALKQSIYIVKNLVYRNNFNNATEALTLFQEALRHCTELIDYGLNKEFNGRAIVGDNPNDFDDQDYGNNNVKPLNDSESHGTHVAGIIAAVRNNDKGINGVANNVAIMPIRAIPNGDEYDKDVALAIRYAVNNGAKIINMSFGKYYSPFSKWVKEAIIYAEKHDVLLVCAAGNESINLDNKQSYPSDHENKIEFVSNFLSVGATEQLYNSNLVASYSNYGKNTVDVFAPGSNIYSCAPNNNYKSEDGTSMAAPMVSGVAALIRSQYPKLTAPEVKQVLMASGLSLKLKVLIGGDPNNKNLFSELSKSSKLVNAYNALIMAAQLTN